MLLSPRHRCGDSRRRLGSLSTAARNYGDVSESSHQFRRTVGARVLCPMEGGAPSPPCSRSIGPPVPHTPGADRAAPSKGKDHRFGYVTAIRRPWSRILLAGARFIVRWSGRLRPVAGYGERPARGAALEKRHHAFEGVGSTHDEVVVCGLALTDLLAGHGAAFPEQPL